jgi:hypothetical protein
LEYMTMTTNTNTTAATLSEALPFSTALTTAGDKYGATKASVTDTLLARLGATPSKALWESAIGFFAGGYRPHLIAKYERLNRHNEPHNEGKGAKCPCRECVAGSSAKAAFYDLAKDAGVTAPSSKNAKTTATKAKNKAKNAKAKAKRAPRTPTKADADKNGYRATLKKAIDGLDAGTLEAMVLCWDAAVKAAIRGMKAKAKATKAAE